MIKYNLNFLFGLICLGLAFALEYEPYLSARYELVLNAFPFARLVHPHSLTGEWPSELPQMASQYIVYDTKKIIGILRGGTFFPLEELQEQLPDLVCRMHVRIVRRECSLSGLQIGIGTVVVFMGLTSGVGMLRVWRSRGHNGVNPSKLR